MTERTPDITGPRTILAIECSNPASGGAGVCVARLGDMGPDDKEIEVLGSCAVEHGARSSDGVMHAVERACTHAQIARDRIDAVAVSVGPGGFTALRIATTSAKVLAWSLQIPVIPVPTARVAAVSIGRDDRPALIALAGKKDASHVTGLDADGSLTNLGVRDAAWIEQACTREPVRTIVCDEHLPDAIALVCDRLGIVRRPIVLDAERCARASCGVDPVDPRDLTPIYAREPDAVTQWRARNG